MRVILSQPPSGRSRKGQVALIAGTHPAPCSNRTHHSYSTPLLPQPTHHHHRTPPHLPNSRSSVVREFRRVAALTAVQLVTSFIHVTRILTEGRATAERQLAVEEKKKGGKVCGPQVGPGVWEGLRLKSMCCALHHPIQFHPTSMHARSHTHAHVKHPSTTSPTSSRPLPLRIGAGQQRAQRGVQARCGPQPHAHQRAQLLHRLHLPGHLPAPLQVGVVFTWM